MTTAWTDPTQSLGQEMNTDDLLQLSRARAAMSSPATTIAATQAPMTAAKGGEVKMAEGGEADSDEDTGVSMLKNAARPLLSDIAPAVALASKMKQYLPDVVDAGTLHKLSDLEGNHNLLKHYTAGVAKNFMGLDPQGRLTLLRSRMPGMLNQILSMPGGLAKLAGYQAEDIDTPVDEAMGTGNSHGFGEHAADMLGYMTSPIGDAKLGTGAMRIGADFMLPVRPSIGRAIGDATGAGVLGSAVDNIDALRALYNKYSPGAAATEQFEDNEEQPGYGEGGEVNQLRRQFLKALGAAGVAATPAAKMIGKTVSKEASNAATDLHPHTFTDLHSALIDESDGPNFEQAQQILSTVPNSPQKTALLSQMRSLKGSLARGDEDEIPDISPAIQNLANKHGLPSNLYGESPSEEAISEKAMEATGDAEEDPFGERPQLHKKAAKLHAQAAKSLLEDDPGAAAQHQAFSRYHTLKAAGVEDPPWQPDFGELTPENDTTGYFSGLHEPAIDPEDDPELR